MGNWRYVVLTALLVSLFCCSSGQIIGEEGITPEQEEYFRSIFLQYDEDADGYISMEENLAQDKVIADGEGKPFDEEHSRVSFARTDYDNDGYVSFEEMTMPRPPEEQCKQLYGDFAEYDGVRSCRCIKGYTADINGTCIQGSTGVCIEQFGEFSDFDGNNNCMCKTGYIPDANGTCIKGTNDACAEQFGALAHYDEANNTCVCNIGSVPDTNGTCVEASDDLCQEWFGPKTAFDGQNSCVCKKGFVFADGECFRGSNKICGSIIAGSKFDGVNSCKCRQGYEVDEVRGICVRSNVTDSKDKPPPKPVPPQGTVTVTVLEARYLPKMDKHTKCDPYAEIMVGEKKKKTRVQKKTYNPEWHETFQLTFNESDAKPTAVLIELWDEDAAKTREYIGQVEIEIAELLVDEFQGWLDLQARDGALVRGFGRNVSMVHLHVRFSDQLPYVPFWEPILAEKPMWLLSLVRVAAGLWLLWGIIIFFILNRSREEGEEDKDAKEEASKAKKE